MKNPLPNLRIGTRLTLMVLIMMAFTLGILFLIYDHYETVLVDVVQNQTEDLSKALEISVQQLTSKGQSDQQLLADYVGRLSALGVTEISILSSERKVVASSNQARVGTRIHAPRKAAGGPLIITGTIGEDEDYDRKISYNLDIPIIVDDKKQGYVRLHVILGDFAALLRSIYLKRSLATSGVFLAGVAASLTMAYRITSPLKRLSAAADRVAGGDLETTVPVERGDEIGKLQDNFNRMLGALREKRRLESQLRRAERAGAVGRLASAVAHEIRNPLNYVSLSVDHLQSAFRPCEAERGEEFDRGVGQIREELRRINALVTEFLNYGRPPRLKVQPCSAREILQEVARFTSPRAGRGEVKIGFHADPGLPPLQADPEGLRTCLLNLVTNGIQAMPRGGTLELRAEPAGPGRICFRVLDSGTGIDPRDLERIFEPYYSTKEAGVGLGLAITQRIVQEHGGRIEVSNRAAGGTEFRILLPLEGPPAARAVEERAANA